MIRLVLILAVLVTITPVNVLAECRVAGCEIPRQQEIVAAKGQNALVFFYSPTCRYCKEQVPILEGFYDRYQWKIIPVDANTRQAANYDIETTPTIVLIDRNYNKSVPIAIGLTYLDELESNILAGLRYFQRLGQSVPPVFSRVN